MSNKKTILVTGSTGNIGKGVALSLAKREVRVVLLGRKIETLESGANSIRRALLAEKIGLIESDIQTMIIDFTDFDSVRKCANDVLIRFPEIHGLVLSVGQMVQKGPNILPNGHELMFATSVLGPFLFTQLLIDRLQQSDGIVVQVIAPFYKEMDWNDIESIKKHQTIDAYNRSKTCERVIIAELARRYSGKLTSIAFNPSFIIDKSDPALKKRWPKGILGFLWWLFALIDSKPPSVAGEPLADIILAHPYPDMNGALFKLNKRIKIPDKAMRDEQFGKRLWDVLIIMTGLIGTELL
ncbi:SDR family NAD(P)-dependent oxidoreductase [Aquiflexum sp.]|uniref:SDR family NAD(P)-dependent oxidoreductase n=1 Tax=Aquiflexum sp. TaxID=1872584 RepID=UPI00359336E0